MLRTRRATQAASMLLFLYLVASARQPLAALLPADLFLRADPLAQTAASLADRQILPYLLWSLPLVVATLLLGRFFCGWICPMGTTLDLFRVRRVNPPRFRREPALRALKYLLLAALLIAAIAGSAILIPLDPLTLLTRTFGSYLYPAFNTVVTGGLFLFYDHGILPDLMVWIDTDLRGNVLPMLQPYVRLSWLFFLIFAAILSLNLLAHRFWCRYLCPLGALLSLLSIRSLLGRRLTGSCTGCGVCAISCRMGAIEAKGFVADGAECVLCGECGARCPKSAVTYLGASAGGRYDPSRRKLLAASGLAALGVAGLRVDSPSMEVNPFLIRPPGARNSGFLERCIRCGNCIKSCPSSGLQPSLFQSGLEGLWSPVLVSRIGPCQYDCTTCGQVCPTAAIEPLDLESKRRTIIGTAYIDQKRCIPWADSRNCIVCEELCPVSPKAIQLDPVSTTDAEGKSVTVKRPRIIRARCIGCGICEKMCPLPGEAAVRVYNTNSLLTETGEIRPAS